MVRTFSLKVAAVAAIGILAGMTSLAYARTPPVQAAAEVAPADLEGWVGELDSDDFDERQDATRRLIDAGKQAVPYAVEAAQGESVEVSSRAVDVLKKLLQAEDKPTQAAALEALKGLSRSDDKALAGRATIALFDVFGEPNRLTGLKIHTGNKRIAISNNADGIKVTVSESVDGKDRTSTCKAENVEDLKENHPEGYKLYEKYVEQSEIKDFWRRVEKSGLGKAESRPRTSGPDELIPGPSK